MRGLYLIPILVQVQGTCKISKGAGSTVPSTSAGLESAILSSEQGRKLGQAKRPLEVLSTLPLNCKNLAGQSSSAPQPVGVRKEGLDRAPLKPTCPSRHDHQGVQKAKIRPIGMGNRSQVRKPIVTQQQACARGAESGNSCMPAASTSDAKTLKLVQQGSDCLAHGSGREADDDILLDDEVDLHLEASRLKPSNNAGRSCAGKQSLTDCDISWGCNSRLAPRLASKFDAALCTGPKLKGKFRTNADFNSKFKEASWLHLLINMH